MGAGRTRSCTQRYRARSFRSALLATATLAALPAAQAQFFSSSGDVFTQPTNIPITNVPVLDLTGNRLVIGNTSAGSFSAAASAVLKADSIYLGQGTTGSGTATITGTGTSVQLGSTSDARLVIGNQSEGSLTVSGGAIVDATINAASCTIAGFRCGSNIGNSAGATGTLIVTGAGSTVSVMNNFVVGNAGAFTQAVDGFDLGTPGGTSVAAITVESGALLRSQSVFSGLGRAGAGSLGTEQSFANITIDGAGSKWLATRNTVDGSAAFFGVGSGLGGHSLVTIQNGGQLVVDGTGGAVSGFDAMNIGTNGGQGAVTVSGAGSSLQVMGNNPIIQVGRGGAGGGQGQLFLDSGATASALLMNIGRDGASGLMGLDGGGTQLTLSGVGNTGVAGAAFANIGRDGGTGQVSVTNGARWVINDGGQDSRTAGGSPGLIVGRGANSTGLLVIDGAGSRIEVSSTSLGLPVGTPDNINPFVGIGYDNASTTVGSLVVSNGGKLVMTGNAVSTTTNPRSTTLDIGGHGQSGSSIAGSGSVTVTGPGSEIIMTGYDPLIRVGTGTGAVGNLSVTDGGKVSTTSFVAGDFGNGIVVLDNGQIALSGVRASNQVGAGMTIGRGIGGVGTLSLDHGSQLTIQNDTLPAGMSFGGDGFFAGGSGSASLANGSSIVMSGTVNANSGFNVGRSGAGSVSLDTASSINVGLATIHVGREAGATGQLDVAGGSIVTGNTVNIGGSSDSVAGGTGAVTVSGAGSTLTATGDSGFIAVGRSGTGALTVGNQAVVNAIGMNVGRSGGGLGNLSVDNATLNFSGQQTSGSQSGAFLSIGNRGGTGTASISNGSVVTFTNAGSAGASLNVGGTPNNPFGTGTLVVTDSQITMTAQPTLGVVRIGHDGNGTATLTNSSLNVAGGSVIIAGQPGSVGLLTVGTNSVVDTRDVTGSGYIGVGATKSAMPGVTQNLAGAGRLVLDNGQVFTDTFEVGANGIVSGNGTINATGDVIIGGTIDPGFSPGRIIIRCNVISLAGSKIILQVAYDAATNTFQTDQLVIGNDSTFDLKNLDVEFDFIGDADPNKYAQDVGFNFDNFFKVLDASGTNFDAGLSTSTNFVAESWADVFTDPITIVADRFDVTHVAFNEGGTGLTFTATEVPEPPTWALILIGLLLACQAAKRRRALAFAALH